MRGQRTSGLRPLGVGSLGVGSLGLLLSLFWATACSPANPEDSSRLVVLYATCTLNQAFLSPWNADASITPNLEALAKESVVFERHTTEAGQSGPAFAALFTGSQADRHGIFHHPSVLREELTLVSETFAEAGYETFFWNGHRMGSVELGYGQGVPEANAMVRRPPDRAMLTGEDARFQGILERLAADPEYKAFVLINFTLSHGPYHEYSPPHLTKRFCERYPERCARVTRDEIAKYLPLYEKNRHELQFDFPRTKERLGLSNSEVERLAAVLELVYSSCVHNLDRYFGRFVGQIRKAGLMEETLLAFTTDHGEALYRDNALFQWCHGGQLVPEVLDIPLLVFGGGLEPGRYEGVTRSIDVFPTLAGLCGIELSQDAGVDGIDLTPYLRGAEEAPDLIALSRTTTLVPEQSEQAREWQLYHSFHDRTDPMLMWVRARHGDFTYKLRDWGGGEWRMGVFDLAQDPSEAEDLFDPESEEHLGMLAYLEAYRQRLARGFAAHATQGLELDPEAEANLRALGYIR